jgi:hypothetical protein
MPFSIDRPLTTLQAEAAARVDVLSGETRLRFITDSPGQEATYTAKLADAKAYIAAGYPTITTPYVWITTEAAATGVTVTYVADYIVYTAGLWAAVGATIEGARQAAKIAINSAPSVTAIRSAETTFSNLMATLH